MPNVHRNNDTRECGALTIVDNQNTVYVNDRLVSIKGNPNTHGAGELEGSNSAETVFVNGIKIIVIGSIALADERGHTNTADAALSGSTNVFAFDLTSDSI
jgi:hypothetical protein